MIRPEKRWPTHDKTEQSLLKSLGAEEDGFALEHFDGEEERSGRVNARGEENEGDVIPMIGASNELLAEKAGTEDRNEGKFGSELDTRKHGGDGRDDDHKH